jgi:hypothetical protein
LVVNLMYAMGKLSFVVEISTFSETYCVSSGKF